MRCSGLGALCHFLLDPGMRLVSPTLLLTNEALAFSSLLPSDKKPGCAVYKVGKEALICA